jgi:predicted aldo/keto reductase-like oxidoreductase
MEPLRGGALAAEQPEDIQRIWARSPRPMAPPAWALRWVWDQPEIVTALSGMNAESQLQENLATADGALARSLDSQSLALIEEVRAIYAARVRVACTTCGYCAPCPSGVAIPEVFSSYNTGAMFDNWKTAAWMYDTFYASQGHGGDQCQECGACETKCPQGIPIMAKLREAHRALTA